MTRVFRHGGWFNRIGDSDRAEWAKVLFDEALRAEALLLAGEATSGSPLGGCPAAGRGRTG